MTKDSQTITTTTATETPKNAIVKRLEAAKAVAPRRPAAPASGLPAYLRAYAGR